MGFARERTQPIAQCPIEPFHMYGPSRLDQLPQRGTDLDREQVSMFIPAFDGLSQGDPLWDNQAGAPTFARQYLLAIGPHQDAPIAVPPRTPPGEGTLVGSLHGDRHCLLDQVVVQPAGGAGYHKAIGSVLHQAPPAFSLIWLTGCAVFFCTNAALLIDFNLAQGQIAGEHLREGRRMMPSRILWSAPFNG